MEKSSSNSLFKLASIRKVKSESQRIRSVRKMLCKLTEEEVLQKPKLVVTYIPNRKPKIVRCPDFVSDNSTEESTPRNF